MTSDLIWLDSGRYLRCCLHRCPKRARASASFEVDGVRFAYCSDEHREEHLGNVIRLAVDRLMRIANGE